MNDSYYLIEVCPKERFIRFIAHDVDDRGAIQRVGGQTHKGEWLTHQWFINKEEAEWDRGGQFKTENPIVQKILHTLHGPLKEADEDFFIIKTQSEEGEIQRDFELEISEIPERQMRLPLHGICEICEQDYHFENHRCQ